MSRVPGEIEPSEFAQSLHGIWGFSTGAEAVRARRVENEHAAAEVGARPVYFDFLDCIYRYDSVGQPMYSTVDVPLHPDDTDLPAQISQAMAASLRTDDTVVCQLAIGRHIDHVIVRQAAEMLHRPLTYDADIPYLLDHPDELEPNTLGLRESLQPVSEPAYRCWIAAMERYTSQIVASFGSHESMLRRMEDLWLDLRGVRFWTRPGPL